MGDSEEAGKLSRSAALNSVEYNLAVDLARGPDTFRSRSEIRFDCASPGTSSFADLHAMTVHRATLNGTNLDAANYRDSRLELPGLARENVRACTAPPMRRTAAPACTARHTEAVLPASSAASTSQICGQPSRSRCGCPPVGHAWPTRRLYPGLPTAPPGRGGSPGPSPSSPASAACAPVRTPRGPGSANATAARRCR
jgi:hypothetical protein